MKFEFVQSGGFAGLSKKLVLDTDDLSPNEKVSVEAAAKNALPLPTSTQSNGCDMMDYELSIDGDKVRLDDGTMTASLRELYNLVQEKVFALKKAKKSS